MANITYADKNKTAALGTAPRTWRDEDANEVKDVVNNFRASLVDGKVPKAQLPDVAIKIGSADDFDSAGISDGYLLYWDQTAGKFKVKAGPGGIGDVEINGNTDVFLFDKTNVGGDITLLIGLNDQLAKTVLAAPEGETGTPTFRRLKMADIVDGEQEVDARYFEVISKVLTLKYILPDIAALQAFVRGPAVLAYVTDPLRGGFFNYVAEGDFVGSPDFGISFPAQDGGYWVRDFKGGINVNWYATIQEAATALPENSTLEFPSPEYSIAGQIDFASNNVRIKGYNTKITQITANQKTFNFNSVAGATVTGIDFYGLGTEHAGAGTGYNNVAGVFFSNCSKVVVNNCKFFNHAGGSIRWTGTVNDYAIINNHVEGIGSAGGIVAGDNSNDIGIGSISSTADNNVIILGNNVSKHCFGVYLARGQRCLVTNNVIHDIPGQHGAYLSSQSLTSVSNNVFENIAYEAIKNQIAETSTIVTDVTISDNVISNVGQSGVVINVTGTSTGSFFSRVSVHGNNIYDVGNYGVIFATVNDGHVFNNNIDTTGAYGIYWDEGNGTIKGNTIKDANWNAILAEITNDTIISGNTITNAVLNLEAAGSNTRYLYYVYVTKGATASVTNPKLFFDNNSMFQFGTVPTLFTKCIRTGSAVHVYWEQNKNLTNKGWQIGSTDELKYMDIGYSPSVDYTVSANLNPTTPIYGRGRRVLYSTQSPADAGMTDTFRAGDFCYNIDAATAPLIGWKCTSGGSPGTWIEADLLDASTSVKGKIEIATQTETNAGTDDTRAVTPLKLAESNSIVGLRGVNVGTDGGAITGALKVGGISRFGYVFGATNYPTDNGEVRTFNGSNNERTWSILKDRDTNELYIQSYDSGGTGLGWERIPLEAAASADTAADVGASYSQTEVQAILDELRDLKTKMRTAGLLAT